MRPVFRILLLGVGRCNHKPRAGFPLWRRWRRRWRWRWRWRDLGLLRERGWNHRSSGRRGDYLSAAPVPPCHQHDGYDGQRRDRYRHRINRHPARIFVGRRLGFAQTRGNLPDIPAGLRIGLQAVRSDVEEGLG